MKKSVTHSILLAIAAFFWGTTFVAQRISGDYLSAYTFCCLRNIFAALILWPIIIFFEKKVSGINPPTTKEEKKVIFQGGIVTGIFLAGTAIFQQVGINNGTTAGKAGFLTACYIIWVPIIGIFFKRACKKSIWLCVVMALIGLYLLCVTEGFNIQGNDVFVLACSLACAFQIISIDYYAPKLSNPIRLAQAEFLVCGIIAAVPMLFVDILGNEAGAAGWLALFNNVDAWIPLLYATFFSSVIAYTLQVIGQIDLNPTVGSLVMSLESVFSVIAAVVILGERMTVKESVGSILVFAAVILSQIL